MPLTPHQRAVCARPNLARAWLWTRTSTDRTYKEYFAHIYRAFSLAEHDALESIRERLLAGTYAPTRSTKLYFPKKSGIQRPFTLLTVEDQIVYQAFVNVIAERLYAIVRTRYNRSVFGHLYAGGQGNWFYVDWRHSYRLYTKAMRAAFHRGYAYTASFDLTACYDTIDHQVLKHFLRSLRLDAEFTNSFTDLLSHWTDASGKDRPLFHGHGIPQGPLPSGMVAEAVLRHFDDAKRPSGVRYFRYVDDIRLFARDEESLRVELVKLDLRSKEVGLFPQASKIDLHRVIDIEEEIKSVSNPPEAVLDTDPPDQVAVRQRIVALTPRFDVPNATRFKWVLGSCTPTSQLSLRLLRVVRRHPHLYEPVFRHIEKAPRLSRSVSQDVLDLLEQNDLYCAYTAKLIRAVRYNLHPTGRTRLERYCRTRLHGSRRTTDPELRAAAASVLVGGGVATWPQVSFNAKWARSWWVRTEVIRHIQANVVGPPLYTSLVNDLLRDDTADVALVAAELVVTGKLSITPPLREIHSLAQKALRNAGRVRQVRDGGCAIRKMMVEVLGPELSPVYWRRIIRSRTYNRLKSRVAVWRGYAGTDPTAWAILTDTINDILLDELFRHDPTIGKYTLGRIGSVINSPTSAFAINYPLVFRAFKRIHDVRLEADLVHPISRQSRRPTRRISFKEKRALAQSIGRAYRQIWQLW